MLWEVMALVGVAGGLAIGAFSIRHCQILNKRFRERGKSLKFLDPYSKHSLPEESIFNEPTKFLSIVFPCYNEENRLPSTLTETLNYLSKRKSEQGLKFSYEIIVVDDGSKDSTVNQALEFSKKVGIGNVRVLKLGKNRGKGAAVREGMLHCRGALCLLADADAATEITDLEKLEAQLRYVGVSEPHDDAGDSLEKRWLGEDAAAQRRKGQNAPLPRDIHDYDLNIGSKLGTSFGSRAHLEKAALAKRAFHRNILTHGFHLLVSLVVGNKIKDTQCGFKLFTRRTAALLFSNMRLQRYCFDVELIHIAQQLKIPVGEVHVRWTEVPGSKVKFHHIIQMAWELLLIKVGYSPLGNWDIDRACQKERKRD